MKNDHDCHDWGLILDSSWLAMDALYSCHPVDDEEEEEEEENDDYKNNKDGA